VAKRKRAEREPVRAPRTTRGDDGARDPKTISRILPASDVKKPRTSLWVLGALYAAMGAAALAHEVAWTRIGRSLLGGDVAALAATLIAVLGGMGLGALLAPSLARRWGADRAFLGITAAAAVYAALVPWLAGGLDGVVGVLFRSLGPGAAFTAASTACATVLFSVPALAMGAGLPLLSQATGERERAPRDAGILYATHALGGAAGGLLTAFVAVPDLGVPMTVAIASTLELSVLALVFVWRRRSSDARPSIPPSNIRVTRTAIFVLGGALVAGVATSSLQTLWTRGATLAIGPSIQGFAVVAALYVLALALGAGLGAAFVHRVRAPSAAYATLALLAALSVAIGVGAVGEWPLATSDVYRAADPASGPGWWSLALRLAPPVVIPIALSAATFPFGVAILRGDGGREVSRDVGWLVAAGAFGNIAGVLVASFVLVPSIGLARAIAFSAALLALAGMLAAASGFRGGPGRIALRPLHGFSLAALAAIVAIAIAMAPRRFDPDVLSRGPFLYAADSRISLGDPIFTHEGVDSTVAVRQAEDDRLLQIDGKVDASANGDASTQILVGLIPVLVADDPSRALVIGLGTGVTADAVRASSDVEAVEVAELVDGVRWAAPWFSRWNGHVLDDPRVEVRAVDGSMLLRHTEARFDVIVSEPSNPWVAGMGDLFAEEAFQAARDRLEEGGVFAAWFHVYSTNLEIVRSIVATFRSVFPDATMWELERGQDYMLVGIRGERRIDLDVVARRLADPEVRGRLERAGVDRESLFSRLVASGDSLAALAADAPVLSQRSGGLEARAARSLYADASGDALAIFSGLSADTGALIDEPDTDEGRALAALVPPSVEAGALARSVIVRALSGDEDGAIRAGERAVGLLPNDQSIRDALATLYLARGKTHALVREDEQAEEALLTAIDLDPADATRADALTTLGDLHYRVRAYANALPRYRAARRLRPDVPLLTERIAECLDELGADDDAARERQLAARLKSYSSYQ
jgi:spermidine synthase